MREGRAFVGVVLAVAFMAVRGEGAGPPRDLEDYVLLGIESAKIGNQAFIDSGDVGVNNAVTGDTRNAGLSCGKHVFINEAAVADQAKMSDGSSVCDLFTNDLVSSLDNVSVRCAGPTAFSPLPVVSPLPVLPAFMPGATDVRVSQGDMQVLGPGSYAAVTLFKHATLELTGGTYEFDSVKTARLAKILVDAPSTINIKGSLRISNQALFGPATGAVGARQIRVNVGGTLARFGQNAHGAIDLFAPNATLSFGRSSLLEGRFVGKNNRMDKSSTFRHPECGNGIPERGEECDDGNRIACDGCSPTCTVERCGDDVVCGSRGEECDPPGSSPAACGGRLCASDCTCEPPRCGDGIKNRPEEECDPPGAATCPPTSPGGAFVACNDDCTCPRGGECGDGVKGPGEECDGADAAACTSGKCLGNCTCDPCGDGIRDAGEQCDPPGSLSCPNGDECAFNCLCPPPLPPTCGDGHINQPQEECDGADDARCPGQCTDTCTCPTGRFCTLTQGAYGAPGGAANGATGLVTQNPGILPVTIGAPGDLSLTVQDQASLICFMPCGGTPAVLCTGLGCSGDMLIDACSNPPILDFDSSGNGSSGGQGGGTLTGQTIAAKLNVALSDLNVPGIPTGLRNFVLPQQLCTTNGTFPIDPDVADGITTVADLLTLADQALRNSLAFNQNDPITRSDITAALDAINRGFDNCASVVTCP